MSPEQIRWAGGVIICAAVAYWVILWFLKPVEGHESSLPPLLDVGEMGDGDFQGVRLSPKQQLLKVRKAGNLRAKDVSNDAPRDSGSDIDDKAD